MCLYFEPVATAASLWTCGWRVMLLVTLSLSGRADSLSVGFESDVYTPIFRVWSGGRYRTVFLHTHIHTLPFASGDLCQSWFRSFDQPEDGLVHLHCPSSFLLLLMSLGTAQKSNGVYYLLTAQGAYNQTPQNCVRLRMLSIVHLRWLYVRYCFCNLYWCKLHMSFSVGQWWLELCVSTYRHLNVGMFVSWSGNTSIRCLFNKKIFFIKKNYPYLTKSYATQQLTLM